MVKVNEADAGVDARLCDCQCAPELGRNGAGLDSGASAPLRRGATGARRLGAEGPKRVTKHLISCLNSADEQHPIAITSREPEVRSRVHAMHLAEGRQHVNKRQEEMPVEAVGVEVRGWPVGGGDNHRPLGKYRFKQLLQDEGVADICDLELVEAQQRRLARHLGGHVHEGVPLGPQVQVAIKLDAGVGVLGRPLLLPPVHSLMHFEHEIVEVDPPLRRKLHAVVEEIHQQRLARAHLAPQVQASGDAGPTTARVARQPPVQRFQLAQRRQLAGILAD